MARMGSYCWQKVWQYYNVLTKNHSEFDILIRLSKEELTKITHPVIAKVITDLRNDRIQIKPGYDGEYGKLLLPKDLPSIGLDLKTQSVLDPQKTKGLLTEKQKGLKEY